MTPRDRDRLLDMLDHARRAMRLIEGQDRARFEDDEVLRYAVAHLVMLVGEAAAQVTPPTRQRHEHIPWRAITTTRNRLVHGYTTVDFGLVWDIARHHLPLLEDQLSEIPGDHPGLG